MHVSLKVLLDPVREHEIEYRSAAIKLPLNFYRRTRKTEISQQYSILYELVDSKLQSDERLVVEEKFK